MAKSSWPCPRCQSTNTVRIMYGLPSEQALEEAAEGKFVLGGCCIHPENPNYHCQSCGHQWRETFQRRDRPVRRRRRTDPPRDDGPFPTPEF